MAAALMEDSTTVANQTIVMEADLVLMEVLIMEVSRTTVEADQTPTVATSTTPGARVPTSTPRGTRPTWRPAWCSTSTETTSPRTPPSPASGRRRLRTTAGKDAFFAERNGLLWEEKVNKSKGFSHKIAVIRVPSPLLSILIGTQLSPVTNEKIEQSR